MRPLVYVAGPYTAPTREGISQNVAVAEAHGKEVLLAGYVPLIPHKISSHWDTDERLAALFGHVDWLERFCFPLLRACRAVYLYPGWETSRGARLEQEYATQHSIPIAYSIDDLRRIFG